MTTDELSVKYKTRYGWLHKEDMDEETKYGWLHEELTRYGWGMTKYFLWYRWRNEIWMTAWKAGEIWMREQDTGEETRYGWLHKGNLNPSPVLPFFVDLDNALFGLALTSPFCAPFLEVSSLFLAFLEGFGVPEGVLRPPAPRLGAIMVLVEVTTNPRVKFAPERQRIPNISPNLWLLTSCWFMAFS